MTEKRGLYVPASLAEPEPLVAKTQAEREALLALRRINLPAGKQRTIILLWNGARLVAFEAVQIR